MSDTPYIYPLPKDAPFLNLFGSLGVRVWCARLVCAAFSFGHGAVKIFTIFWDCVCAVERLSFDVLLLSRRTATVVRLFSPGRRLRCFVGSGYDL